MHYVFAVFTCQLQIDFLSFTGSSSPGWKKNLKELEDQFIRHEIDAPAKFVPTHKGNSQLIDSSGYRYTRHYKYKTGTVISWICRNFRSTKCRSRAVTEGDTLKFIQGKHTHTPWDMK